MIYSYRVVAIIVTIDKATLEHVNKQTTEYGTDIDNTTEEFIKDLEVYNYSVAIMRAMKRIITAQLHGSLNPEEERIITINGIVFLGSFDNSHS